MADACRCWPLSRGILSPFDGSGATAVNVPNTPALSCLQFVFQGAAIGGAAAALDLSNAVIVQLGQQPARANQ